MSDPVETYGQFGQTLAFAETALNNILQTHLAARGVPPERWYALKLTAQAEPVGRAAVIDGLSAGGKVQAVDAEPLLRDLEDDGLLEGGEHLSLTEAGRSYFVQLREYVTTPTNRLLGHFELADIETTIRTLHEITIRAQHQEFDSAI